MVEDLLAIAALVDHPLDAARLPFNRFEPRQEWGASVLIETCSRRCHWRWHAHPRKSGSGAADHPTPGGSPASSLSKPGQQHRAITIGRRVGTAISQIGEGEEEK